MSKKQDYLEHVTGLRGFAIVAIILFHAFKDIFPNGYLGVNVFLTITGYFLFSSFLKDDFRFSLSDFIKKRAARLFPAFTISIVLFLIICAFILPFDYFEKQAKIATFSLLGLSNIYFHFSLGDYFSDKAETIVFLTSWYFSVLLQIYLCYAGLSAICSTRSARIRRITLLLIGGISFLYFLPPSDWKHIVASDSGIISNTYFSSLAKLWIVACGAGAGLLPELKFSSLKKALSLISLAVIVGLLFFSASSCAIKDILVVICSALCIRYAPCNIGKIIVQNPLICKIGAISFSLYLIHWPVIVLATYIQEGTPSPAAYTLIFIGIIILSVLLFILVEKKVFSFRITLLTWGLAVSGAIFCWGTNGLRNYLHPAVVELSDCDYTHPVHLPDAAPLSSDFPAEYIWRMNKVMGGVVEPFRFPHACYYLGKQTDEPTFILMGDSHALALVPGFDIVGKEEGWCGVYAQAYVMPFCQYLGVSGSQVWTEQKQNAILAWLGTHTELRTVIIAQFWASRMGDGYKTWKGDMVDITLNPEKDYEKTRDFIRKLRALNKEVIILTDVPEVMNRDTPHAGKIAGLLDTAVYVRKQVVLGKDIDMTRLQISKSQYEEYNKCATQVLNQLVEDNLVRVLHIENHIFQSNHFSFYQNGKLLYSDSHHLSPIGAAQVVRACKEEISRLLRHDVPHGDEQEPISPATAEKKP